MEISENSKSNYSKLFLETIREIIKLEREIDGINIILLHPRDLNDYTILNQYFKDSYIKDSFKREELVEIKGNSPICPNIFLCFGIDITSIEQYHKLHLDNRVKFLDSNICNYFINIRDFKEFEIVFHNVIQKIREYHSYFRQSIYLTNINKEFFEFQTRIFINSFLAKFEGAHSTDVTPFKFHSETVMQERAESYLKRKQDKPYLPHFKWRLLLVDDFADNWKNDEGKLKVGKENAGPTKKEILEYLFSEKNEKNNERKKYDWIDIEVCKSIDEFVSKYSEEKNVYDIILLDYLLGSTSTGHKAGREYSTDILRWIKGDLIFYGQVNNLKACTRKEYKRMEGSKKREIQASRIIFDKNLQGPLGRFWFFPISVFSFAFMEDIRQMGYSFFDDDWVIARGADPVNTPELFRYSLFMFMEAQLDEIFKNINEENNIGNFPIKNNLLLSFIENHFSKIEIAELKRKAKEIYPAFLNLLSSYRRLKKDAVNNSNFANKFLGNYEDVNYLISHFQHLLYMLAYLPAQNWSEMWDEYIIIRQYFIEQRFLSNGLKKIQEYIVSLQQS